MTSICLKARETITGSSMKEKMTVSKTGMYKTVEQSTFVVVEWVEPWKDALTVKSQPVGWKAHPASHKSAGSGWTWD